LSKEAMDENSTTDGSPSEGEQKLSEEELATLEKDRQKRQKDLERKRKKDEEIQAKVDAEQAVIKAAEKVVRDAKKAVEQEKKDKEMQKQNKKIAEAAKRDEEKKVRDEQKLLDTAKKEKEGNAKRAEEQRLKQLAENDAEAIAKALETKTFEFERDRLDRCEKFDRAVALATGLADAALAAIANPIIASGLAAVSAQGFSDPEELLDNQLACLGSFFALGATPAEDALPLSSGLRARVKKLRTKVRASAARGDFVLEAPADTAADASALEQLLLVAKGEAPAPLAPAEAAAAAAAAAAEEAAPSKSKKKAKAKAAPEDEDLDALLAEFGVEASGSKKKGGKKK